MELKTISKEALVADTLFLLRETLRQMTAQAVATAQGATHAESRSENSKDTRAIEASYLARGQAARVTQLEAELAQLQHMPLKFFGPTDSISASALIRLYSEENPEIILFLAPTGGGNTLVRSPHTIRIVTPLSPLGAAVLGKQLDDLVEFRLAGKALDYEIIELA